MSAHARPPSRNELIDQLRRLTAGKLSRRSAVAWASPWLSRLHEIRDKKVKVGVENLGMTDLPSTDREYLYDKADFEAWLNDLTGESR